MTLLDRIPSEVGVDPAIPCTEASVASCPCGWHVELTPDGASVIRLIQEHLRSCRGASPPATVNPLREAEQRAESLERELADLRAERDALQRRTFALESELRELRRAAGCALRPETVA